MSDELTDDELYSSGQGRTREDARGNVMGLAVCLVGVFVVLAAVVAWRAWA